MTREYTSATNVRHELRASSNFSASTTPNLLTITRWIQEESANIELRTGAIYSSNTESSVLYDYDGSGVFRFAEPDVTSIDSLEYNVNSDSVTPSWVTLTEGKGYNYIIYSDEGEVHFLSGENATYKIMPKGGKQRLRITYTRGKSSTPLEVQKLCTLLVCRRVIQSLGNSQSNSEGGTVQVGTIRVTEPGNYSISYLKTMDAEIERLYNYIGSNLNTFRYTRVYD